MHRFARGLVFMAFWGILAMQGYAQTASSRYGVGVSIGGEGTTFVNNPFNILVSKILIPGFNGALHGRVRVGNHFGVQLSPGYTFRPYRSERTFIGDSLNPNGTANPLAGKTIDRHLSANLHEFRVGIMFYYYLRNPQSGLQIGIGPELQWNKLKKFDIAMSQNGSEFIHESSDLVKLPMLPAAQFAIGYSWALQNGMELKAESFVKYSPIFVEDGKTLSWTTAGVRLGWWL